MSAFATPTDWTAPATGEAVAVPRWHIVAIAILTCVPLPLLSLAATVMPLPQLLERAAATFVSIGSPALGDDGPGIREHAVAVRSLEIRYEPLERPPTTPTSDRPARGSHTRLKAVEPGRGAAVGPGDSGSTGSVGGTGGLGDPPTGADSPGGGPSAPDAPTEPPSPTPPTPGTGGGGAGGGTSNGPGSGGQGGGTANGQGPGSGGGGSPSDGGPGGAAPGAGTGGPGGSGSQGGGPDRP